MLVSTLAHTTHHTEHTTHNMRPQHVQWRVESSLRLFPSPLSPLLSVYLVVFDAHKFEGALVVARARLYFEAE